MSTDFFELSQSDNKYVVINRAYIVSLRPEEDDQEKGAVLCLNREAASFSSIHVKESEVQALKEWLLLE